VRDLFGDEAPALFVKASGGDLASIEPEGHVAVRLDPLRRWPELTAVCAVNDPVAIGAIRTAQQLGRAVPRELACIGFDDISWAALNSPPLSTVHVYKRRMGQLAARRLVELLQEPEVVASRTSVATQLVIRESCGTHE
jgi:DNA-binding LacI/PurR family transcriptional regulator